MTIPFNKAPVAGNEVEMIQRAIEGEKLAGGGHFAQQVQGWFESRCDSQKALLTPSCTHALEMAAILIDICPGDEIIMPSYTFVSTANAFVLRGASIVFVDVDPKTMNMDIGLVEQAITDKTKAIVPVHYAGVACEMDELMSLANTYDLFVIEDAAQGMMSNYRGRELGGIGHLGAYSFHETKNYTSGGEGGLLLINDARFVERAEILREKGTNRAKFFRGMVDKYSWVDIGSSYLPSEIQAAYLWAQLQKADLINNRRLHIWKRYSEEFQSLVKNGFVELPFVPTYCTHNAHMFYLKLQSLEKREDFISFLASEGIQSAFHYVPLHSSMAGKKFGRFNGYDRFTTNDSERLVRLPLFLSLTDEQQTHIIATVHRYFS